MIRHVLPSNMGETDIFQELHIVFLVRGWESNDGADVYGSLWAIYIKYLRQAIEKF